MEKNERRGEREREGSGEEEAGGGEAWRKNISPEFLLAVVRFFVFPFQDAFSAPPQDATHRTAPRTHGKETRCHSHFGLTLGASRRSEGRWSTCRDGFIVFGGGWRK